MALTVPNAGGAAFSAQARLDSVDLDAIVAGSGLDGTVSGAAVTTTGAANGSVSVAAGQIRFDDVLYTVTTGTVAIAANATGNPRQDLIVVGSSGTPTRVAGTAAAVPVFPLITAGSVVLAAVYVPNGHTGTTIIPANTITDKRVFVPVWMSSNTRTTANISQTDDNKVALTVKGKSSVVVKALFEIDDFNDAPILWIMNTGGIGVNDRLATQYSVPGTQNFIVNIYGHVWSGTMVQYAFAGPPGNMMSWTDSVHEVYEVNRAATVGAWVAVAACTIATQDLGSPPSPMSPTTYRSAIKITNTTGGTAWIAQPGGAFSLPDQVAGTVISGVAWLRSATAAASRNATVRFSFYTAAGAAVGADIDSTATPIPNTGVWTIVQLPAITVPATATNVQIHVLIASANTEIHYVCGVGIMQGVEAIFAPPLVSQNPAGHIELGSYAGDRWVRLDRPGVPGKREYVCVTGGAPRFQRWRAIDSSTVYRLEADVTNSTVTAANVVNWAVDVVANEVYTLTYTFLLTSAALTTGWQFGWTGPASPTLFNAVIEYQSSATAWTVQTVQSFTTGTLVTAAYVATPTPIAVRISAQLINGANAGTVNFRFSSEVAASAIVLKRGGVLMVT
jgi:hypothetical protein